MKLLACAAAAALSAAQPQSSERLVYATDDPFGGLHDVYGFDIGAQQSVATRFTPRDEHRLGKVRLWLWNNDADGDPVPITVSLRGDARGRDSASLPGETPLESWSFEIPYTGFADPRLFEFASSEQPAMLAHTNYWIVVESNAPPGAAWAVGQPGTGYGAVRMRGEESWRVFQGSVGASEVWGAPAPLAVDTVAIARAERPRSGDRSADDGLGRQPAPCAADFDQSGTIDVHDAAAFLRAWTRREPAGDFDRDGRLDTPDAVGFLDAWCRGC